MSHFIAKILYLLTPLSVLISQTRSHVGVNTYKCDQCTAAFRLHGELRQHRQQHFLEQKGMLGDDRPSTEESLVANVMAMADQTIFPTTDRQPEQLQETHYLNAN